MDDERWKYRTHKGARLAMLERNLTQTVRERLEGMQAHNQLDTSHARDMRERKRRDYSRWLFYDDCSKPASSMQQTTKPTSGDQ
ncbi:hypothetical protein ATO7_06165 [Oceanococcus atlanticus]|uniref:Uncharacterized protein n=1 Tax=Oceanococcus atlanticus TaxID=1317117 RepID=A0A1Y1SID3_9GAMM|nr:hypothetical protein [Oceanococcus atlanticus]ORE89442.1 hypothetical protein ATO7_06165 [Oceanococcus atlanticus]